MYKVIDTETGVIKHPYRATIVTDEHKSFIRIVLADSHFKATELAEKSLRRGEGLHSVDYLDLKPNSEVWI